MQYISRNFIKFVIYGIVSVMFDYITYITSLKYLNIQMDVSKILGLCMGLICSYCLNYNFNFSHTKNNFFKRGIKYFLLYIFLNSLNVLENRIFFTILHDINIAYFISAILSAFINYLFVQKFIFI